MKVVPTIFADVLLIEPQVFVDERGSAMETYHAEKLSAARIPGTFVQENHVSSRRGSLRGLHYRVQRPQGKLVRVVGGEIYDVVVDLRRSSSTFGKAFGTHLSGQNKLQIWVPPGFAHGFYVLSDWAEIILKMTDVYVADLERSLLWNDPGLGIKWPLIAGKLPIVSAKDAQGKPLRDAELFD